MGVRAIYLQEQRLLEKDGNMAKDIYHKIVKDALEKDGWTINTMDKTVKNYQKILEVFLTEEAQSKSIPGIEFQVVTDTRHNHFQLVETGWYDKQYIHSIVFHFQIKPDGKVWILANNTDTLIAEELVKRGIPAGNIVLGFHPANVRPYTGFAVA